jgi:hypothetical protein
MRSPRSARLPADFRPARGCGAQRALHSDPGSYSAGHQSGSTCVTRSRALLVLPALLVALLLAGRTVAAQSPAAQAQTGSPQELVSPAAPQPPATPGPAELESLIETLEDPARRDQLIATLRLLQEGQPAESPTPPRYLTSWSPACSTR